MKKRMLSILLMAAMLLTMLPMTALAVSGDTFTADITVGDDTAVPCTFTVLTEPADGDPGTVQIGDESNVAITTGSGALTIPTSIQNGGNTYTVTKIGQFAFIDCAALTGTLEIPNTITEIQSDAFFRCTGLTDLSFASGSALTAINGFGQCTNLDGSLVIPASVKTIGTDAFNNCSSLDSLGFAPNSQLETIDFRAFYDCSGLGGTLTIPAGITNINGYAFKSCSNLTAVEFLGNTLPTIGGDVFQNCTALATVYVPSTWTGGNSVTLNGIAAPFTTDAGSLVIDALPNEAPTISAIVDQTTNEDTATDSISITVGDSGDNPTAAGSLILSAASDNETLLPTESYSFGGSGTDRTLTITPAANESGTANVTVTVKDEYNAAATSTFVLTVNAVNDPPVAKNFTKTGNEDTDIPLTFSDFILNVTDVEGDSKTKAKFTGLPANGTLVRGSDPIALDAEIPTDQLSFISFVPNANWYGTTSFTWQCYDGTDYSSNATVTITVNPVNDAPVASDSSFTTDENTAKNGNLAATDVDSGALTYSVVTDQHRGH